MKASWRLLNMRALVTEDMVSNTRFENDAGSADFFEKETLLLFLKLMGCVHFLTIEERRTIIYFQSKGISQNKMVYFV